MNEEGTTFLKADRCYLDQCGRFVNVIKDAKLINS